MAAKRGAKKSGGTGSKRPRPSESYRDDDGDYDVGFAKPPKRTQFKPGASGNPKGRPKWKDRGMLTEMIGKELYRPVRITQNGETLSLPALQVALRRLVRMGAEGNSKSVESMLKIALNHSETVLEFENDRISKMTAEERASRVIELLTRAQRRIEAREGKQRKGDDH
jgi:hypothetical protein